MDNLELAARMAERLRQEPYILFRNDCITKSMRFKRDFGASGVQARVVVCIGLAKARWFGHWLTVPVIHSWGEVEARRLETSRPLGSSGLWGIVSVKIKPAVSVRL